MSQLVLSASNTASDADGDTLVFSSVGKPSTGTLIFTPGTSSFTYQAPAAGLGRQDS